MVSFFYSCQLKPPTKVEPADTSVYCSDIAYVHCLYSFPHGKPQYSMYFSILHAKHNKGYFGWDYKTRTAGSQAEILTDLIVSWHLSPATGRRNNLACVKLIFFKNMLMNFNVVL